MMENKWKRGETPGGPVHRASRPAGGQWRGGNRASPPSPVKNRPGAAKTRTGAYYSLRRPSKGAGCSISPALGGPKVLGRARNGARGGPAGPCAARAVPWRPIWYPRRRATWRRCRRAKWHQCPPGSPRSGPGASPWQPPASPRRGPQRALWPPWRAPTWRASTSPPRVSPWPSASYAAVVPFHAWF